MDFELFTGLSLFVVGLVGLFVSIVLWIVIRILKGILAISRSLEKQGR